MALNRNKKSLALDLKLTEARFDDSDSFNAVGRPVAVISNVLLEYRPAPPPRTPARRR